MKRIKKIAAIVWGAYLLITAVACGTTRQFHIQSEPDGALVMTHDHEDMFISQFVNYGKETPFTQPICFMQDGETHYITVEKRGYKAAVVPVDKDSALDVHVELERLPGVPTRMFNPEILNSTTFALMPVEAEVITHSGLGALDKKKISEEKSQAASRALQDELSDALGIRAAELNQRSALARALDNVWPELKNEVNSYLLSLNYKRLPYYSLPPLLSEKVAEFKSFCQHHDAGDKRTSNEPDYLLYVYAKCVSETAGRKVGNFLLSVLGAAASGVASAQGRYFYYNPQAFEPDSGTFFMLYVIDRNSSEVVYAEPYYCALDITKDKDLKKAAQCLARFPGIER